MPGKMTDDPTDAIHLSEVAFAFTFSHIVNAAYEFSAGKTELIDKWVGHGLFFLFYELLPASVCPAALAFFTEALCPFLRDIVCEFGQRGRGDGRSC